MERLVGTVVRGIRTPIIRKGDNIEEIVVKSLLDASRAEGFSINDRDIVGVTEAVVARAQGNYASIDDIAADISSKFGEDNIGVVFPILSRNRFAICLRGIAKKARKITLLLSYPSDEVGNHLLEVELLDEKNINPWTDVLTENQYREYFGDYKHIFTGIDYVDYYKQLAEEFGAACEIVFSNNPLTILDYTKCVLVCDIHSRFRTKKILKANGAHKVFGLDEILAQPVNGSGYNEKYGLLGSNKATEDTIKLFPRNCQVVVDRIKEMIFSETRKNVDVLIYGDGAFKDPVGKIWELADPVVSPAYTGGLEGTTDEIKLKYLADNEFGELEGEALYSAIYEYINNRNGELKGMMESQGTTPRRIVDLVGSLCDLTSGSGAKGTPVIFIQGYFDNYCC